MIIILKLDKRANKEDILSTFLEALLGSPLNLFATLENNLFSGDGYISQIQIIQLKSNISLNSVALSISKHLSISYWTLYYIYI